MSRPLTRSLLAPAALIASLAAGASFPAEAVAPPMGPWVESVDMREAVYCRSPSRVDAQGNPRRPTAREWESYARCERSHRCSYRPHKPGCMRRSGHRS